MTIRIFAPPYTLLAHQATAYVRLRRLPFKLYCSNLGYSLLAGYYHRARLPVRCVVTADGESCLHIWHLARAQREAELAAFARTPAATETSDTPDRTASYAMLLGRRDHPQLHLVNWTTTVFANWWLNKVGQMYRYCRGNKVDMMRKIVQYVLPLPYIGVPRQVADKFRARRQAELAALGITSNSMSFFEEHFRRMCVALETHLAQQQPSSLFLLGTRHPTLADVTLGGIFSTFFVQDDPPISFLTEHCPHLLAYIERVITPQGAVEDAPMPDVIPATLGPFLALQLEVMPFLVAQCAAFTAFMTGDAIRTMRREALGPPWQGCHGYLLPKFSEVRSLMIIDATVGIIRAQSHDLELALLAASEVCEGVEGEEGRGAVSTRVAQESASQAVMPDSSVAAIDAACCGARSASKGGHDGMPTTRQTSPSPASHTRGDQDVASRVFDFCNGFVEMSADEADFYRVFTRKGRRAHGLTPQSAHTMSTASTLTSASDVLAQQPIEEQLRCLRHMMREMHNPQYTLASTVVGFREYVAVVPEFEVARLRGETQTT